MSTEKGNLSINSENILPIIKKWLYSDLDIFIRELVSNATDAVTKLKKLSEMGDAPNVSKDEKYKITVFLDKENKIITVEDNGLGMTDEEIKEYINQIAFSGASDFMEKFKDKAEESSDIIGHFGLGFYSAFMVADVVEIDSLSYKEGAAATHWKCDGGIEYEMGASEKNTRGSKITLHVGDDGESFLDDYTLRSTLRKYCGFLPIEIYFETAEDLEKKEKEEIPINDLSPLWLKTPNECKDKEYKEFYHKVFSDISDPLFWIHLNMDYPFRLKGILYFPKLKHELESIEGQVKLYNNQVFIADNIKEVIPEFLLLLKGTLDCPDLPLNVSRSFLQNDGYVTKMSGYITKKVADKLNSIFKKDRKKFNSYWDDISPFIKYGCIKDRDFYEKIKESLLFKTISNDYMTITEFLEKNKEKTGETIFYSSDEKQQSQYIKMFREQGMDAVILTTNLDTPFITYLEGYDSKFRFSRIDSHLSESLKEENTEDNSKLNEELESLFKENIKNKDIKVAVENLKSQSVSGVILQSEEARRMVEIGKAFGGNVAPYPEEEELILNQNSSLVKLLLNLKDDESKKDEVSLICEQVYDLAFMSHKTLDSEAMTKFIERSNKILEMAVK